MIQIPQEELQEGMVLGKSVYRENGELLLASGYQINSKVLRKLKELDVPHFWIQEKGTETIIPQQLIEDHIALQSQIALMDNAKLIREVAEIKEKSIEGVHKAIREKSKFRNILMPEKIKKSVDSILDSVLGSEMALVNLNSIRTKANYLYQHAIDVTITAVLLANKLQLNRNEIEELAMGCMLMDLGMVVLPEEITAPTHRLSFQEFTILKEHTTFGYCILRENKSIPLTSAHIAYQHHERQDGAGYPRRLKGNNALPVRPTQVEKKTMHRYAEIAAVVDTYISLVSPRPGQESPKSPDQAIRTLITTAGSQLNRTIVDALITLIPIFPVGTRVSIMKDDQYNMLGYSGIVARYRQEAPDKPCIMVIYNRNKEKINPILIDLLEEPEIKIQFMLLS